MNQYHNFRTIHTHTLMLFVNVLHKIAFRQTADMIFRKITITIKQKEEEDEKIVHEAFIVYHYIYNKRVVNMIFSVCAKTHINHRDTNNVIFE